MRPSWPATGSLWPSAMAMLSRASASSWTARMRRSPSAAKTTRIRAPAWAGEGSRSVGRCCTRTPPADVPLEVDRRPACQRLQLGVVHDDVVEAVRCGDGDAGSRVVHRRLLEEQPCSTTIPPRSRCCGHPPPRPAPLQATDAGLGALDDEPGRSYVADLTALLEIVTMQPRRSPNVVTSW